MRVINHIIILTLSLVCISCKVDFDFSGLDGEPLLYLDMNLAYDPTSYEDGVIPEDVHLSLNGFIYAIPSAAAGRHSAWTHPLCGYRRSGGRLGRFQFCPRNFPS